jgi:hypothetical protein
VVDNNFSFCQEAHGTLIYGEGWYDNDFDWYLQVPSTQATSLGITPTDIQNLQAFSECQHKCNLLAETIGSDVGYAGSKDDQQMPPYCLDVNHTYWYSGSPPGGHCKKKKKNRPSYPYQASFTGVFVTDNNHGYKEIHPQAHQKITKRSTGALLVDQTGWYRCTNSTGWSESATSATC